VDDALGEAFDKTAKMLGLDYPGGPKVEAIARNGDPERFRLPRPMLGRSEPNFSFAGLKTAIRQAAQRMAPLSEATISDLCASFQAAVVDCIVDRTQIAMQLYCQKLGPDAPKKLVLSGGVGANQAIRHHLELITEKFGFELVVPPAELCTDNAAMIAWAGAERLRRGWADDLDFEAQMRWPLDLSAPNIKGTGDRKLTPVRSSRME
jgi:N6-L-threonylcarbamoyladenine synthase